MTERASPSSESNCTAIISAFVRADVIAVLLFFGSVLALSVTFGDIARVAAPSVCYAVACILLAAAPTAPPCFRRCCSQGGEPLAKRANFSAIL